MAMPEKTPKLVTPETVRQLAVSGAAKAIKAGRVTSSTISPTSTNSASRQIQGLFQQYAPLSYQLPWEILDYVELLATYNADYSQAVENIKMLANTGHELFVDASSELKQKQIKALLEVQARRIQARHGGIDGVIDKLLDQAATFGAMCGEWVLNDDLTEVVDFIDLSPKSIRFFWIDDEQRYAPFQKVNSQQAKEARDRGQETRGDCIRLNEITFHYYAFDAAPESPYGTPPFLAALSNIAIQRDMVHNMAQIVKKIGLLGVIDLTIERLPPLPGETDEEYATRAGLYLDNYVEIAEDMVKEGGIVHFDDVAANTWQIGGNAAGATNIHKANEEMVFSGLKSMPSVQGRSYSTTETYAGIAYEIIIRNTAKYQRAARRVIEAGYWLMCQFAGMQPDKITLKFNSNRSLNRLQDAQSEAAEIQNALMKWLLGFIDQVQAAQELGYNSPATAYDVPPEGAVSASGGSGSSGGGDDTEESGSGSEDAKRPNSPTYGSMEEEDEE